MVMLRASYEASEDSRESPGSEGSRYVLFFVRNVRSIQAQV